MIKLISPIDQIDDENLYGVGVQTQTKDGNEYIYLPGTTSVARYDWISFGTAADTLSYGSVTRLIRTTSGLVGIAQAAIVSNHFGWFLIRGVGWGNAGDTGVASGSMLYSSGTAGTAVTSVAPSHGIRRSLSIGTGAAGGTIKVLLEYPYFIGTAV